MKKGRVFYDSRCVSPVGNGRLHRIGLVHHYCVLYSIQYSSLLYLGYLEISAISARLRAPLNQNAGDATVFVTRLRLSSRTLLACVR